MKKPTTYIVAIATYDECGSDGMVIDNAIPFTDIDELAKDYANTIGDDFAEDEYI